MHVRLLWAPAHALQSHTMMRKLSSPSGTTNLPKSSKQCSWLSRIMLFMVHMVWMTYFLRLRVYPSFTWQQELKCEQKQWRILGRSPQPPWEPQQVPPKSVMPTCDQPMLSPNIRLKFVTKSGNPLFFSSKGWAHGLIPFIQTLTTELHSQSAQLPYFRGFPIISISYKSTI